GIRLQVYAEASIRRLLTLPGRGSDLVPGGTRVLWSARLAGRHNSTSPLLERIRADCWPPEAENVPRFGRADGARQRPVRGRRRVARVGDDGDAGQGRDPAGDRAVRRGVWRSRAERPAAGRGGARRAEPGGGAGGGRAAADGGRRRDGRAWRRWSR